MPDIFIPIDTTWYTKYYGNLSRKGVFQQFVVNYVDQNRAKLAAKYADFERFNREFKVSAQLQQEFVQYGKKMGVEPNETEFAKSEREINMVIKGLIAQKLWDTSEYFRVINNEDETIKKALETFTEWSKTGI
jgi:carboxyl-terminal processing protease